MKIPAQVSALLQDLTAHLPVILGRKLVGLYVYGSLTQGAFNPKRSDVDCIVVTQRALSDTKLNAINVGPEAGRYTLRKIPHQPQPSIRAASSRSSGTCLKVCRIRNVPNAEPK